MSKPNVCLLLAVALIAACTTNSPSSPSADASVGLADAAPVPSIDAAAPHLASFYSDAATSVCSALFRCCDAADLETYFAPFRGSELLADYRDRLPPAVTLDEPECRELVAEIFAITPFGDWVEAARSDRVDFDGAAFTGCLAALDQASCGEPARRALFDGTCLGFAAPGGGDLQRKIFPRSAAPGTACTPIRDGVGAAFFGTCNPHAAFCCYQDPDHPESGCSFPFDGDGAPRTGSCAPAIASGQTCSTTPPLAICRTGASCDSYDLVCVAEATAELEVGDPCIDQGFNLLGDCVDSFCDLFGSSCCEPLRDDGGDCSAPYECSGGDCVENHCAPLTTCDGPGGGEGPDAGPSTPDAGPGTPDAGPETPDAGSAVSGERCDTAFDLEDASAGSELAGYDYTVAGGFGAANDYNPYQDASPALPPACSLVYDAAGAERVYAITLDPGDRLDLRYAVEPGTIPGALYLLDGCSPEVTWPDYDGSGMCGSNEYHSQGYCGYLGCDPIEWSFTYPEEIDDDPTTSRTFWIVVDHLGTAPATGYRLDWRIAHD